jgi:hypothetical protein
VRIEETFPGTLSMFPFPKVGMAMKKLRISFLIGLLLGEAQLTFNVEAEISLGYGGGQHPMEAPLQALSARFDAGLDHRPPLPHMRALVSPRHLQ